jgi:NAD(P)-dependent dehydrogenase (short-subunit alcohol dehydrogenase family)
MRTSVARALLQILPPGAVPVDFQEIEDGPCPDRILIADGLIRNTRIQDQSKAEIEDSLWINLVSVVRICNMILETNPQARICVIGSESGINGSHDETYALAKAGLHAYVKWHQTTMNQQLVCVCPPLIGDSYWVSQRHDYPDVLERRPWCRAMDVAKAIKGALYERGPEVTNLILRVQPTAGPRRVPESPERPARGDGVFAAEPPADRRADDTD